MNSSRTDLVIDPPQAFGNPPTTGYANDPVNTSTGNFIENETDLSFPGAAASLVVARCYNSFDGSAGAFGPGWSSLAEAGLMFDTVKGAARFRLPDGRQIVFPRLGAGWDRAVDANCWLTETPGEGDAEEAAAARVTDTGWLISGNDGGWWRFGIDGTLLSYGIGPDDAGTAIRLVRDAGRLVRLVHARGRSFDLLWGEAGGSDRIVAARSSDGRVVEYTYDAAGQLTSATGPAGTRSYRWTEPADTCGRALIGAVIDPDGVVEAENVYDDQFRVMQQRSPFGRLTRFGYAPGRVTVVSDENGSRSNTWIADERGRLVGVVDAEEHRQSISYDRYGNPVLVIERDGATTIHEYDVRGRRVRTVTPSGADVSWGFDESDRVTIVVTEEGAVTSLKYQGVDRNPSTITDPEGGVTHLVWQQNLLTQVTDPVGVVVRFGYDEFGDLVSVTDADSNTARIERDALGRVTAAITPSGHRTGYEYDSGTGLLVTRRNPDEATWHYEHSTAGRLTAIIDPTGARTVIEHGPHGAETATTDPLGRTVTRQLDDLGNLAAVALPDGSTWRFTHDALSRLTGITDPTGATRTQEYDRAGHLIATIDPTGQRRDIAADQSQGLVRVDDGDASVTARHDPLGRLTSLGQADGSAAVLTYDRCGRPVESLDPEGGLTLTQRDPAGRPVAITTPTGAITRYEYDACGRIAAAMDPLGARTTIKYDPDGHPVQQTLPSGDIAWTRYDVCGRVVAHHRPGAGTVAYTYDRAGRVVATRDPRYGRREFEYDPAGQLVAAVDGNGGTTRYDYDTNGRAVQITDPLGGTTRREFDPMNRCTAETDPLGRTTRAGYDQAGRLAWQEDPDGHRTTWTYDDSGRPLSMAVDGRTITAITRDLRARIVTIDDYTRSEPARHQLEWNRRGQLVRRTRDGREVSWSYDAGGRRSSMTTPDGQTTRYGCDSAGRLTWVDHPLLGRARFDRDASGRLTSATAGGLVQSWEHRDGFITAHTITDDQGATRTVIDRDTDGRITRISRDPGDGPVTTEYTYDQACQLTAAHTRRAAGESLIQWRYDDGGRLVAETSDVTQIENVYDPAGQLRTTTKSGGRQLSYEYDGLGRRARSRDDLGRTRDFSWDHTGHLTAVTDRTGDHEQRTTLHTDALGELATVDGTEFFWDTAAFAGAPVLVGDTSVVAAGAVTGIGTAGAGETGWAAPGWRTTRTHGTDPWTPSTATPLTDPTSGLQIGAAAEITIAGLEWMGARVYDPTSHGFLSVDPLDPPTGASWAANPYSYAGNDPLHALDPTGLRPVTEAQLQAYRDTDGIGGAVHAVGNALDTAASATGGWLKNNWEYVAGGAMVVGGGILIATGVGGPAGMMLVSAGADTIIQKATTGTVKWGEVGVSFVAGAVGGGLAAAKLGATGIRAAVVAGAVSGAVGGAGVSGFQYADGPGPHTVSGFVGATAKGGVEGAIFGGVGGAAAHGFASVAGRELSEVSPNIVPATQIRFSQHSVNGAAEIELSMRANGWVGDAIDVVRMPDGGLTSIDNTRLLAARRVGMDVRANLREFDELLPADPNIVDRFTTRKGGAPTTWGDAVMGRIENQNAGFREAHPMGSPTTGWNGN